MNLKNTVITLLKILVAGGLIYWMVQKGFLDLGELYGQASGWDILVLLGLGGFGIICVTFRWHSLYQVQGFQTPFSAALRLNLVGLFFNFAMPGGVGGDVVKTYYLSKETPMKNGYLKALTSALMDRLFGLWGMAILALIGLLFGGEKIQGDPRFVALGGALAGLVVGFIIFFLVALRASEKSLEKLTRLLLKLPAGGLMVKIITAIHSYGGNTQVMIKTMLLTFGSQLSATFFMYIVGQIMGISLGIEGYLFAVPLGFMAMALPVSPAGIGVGQAALFFLFNLMIGSETQVGPNGMTAFQLMTFFYSLVGAYFYLRQGRRLGDINAETVGVEGGVEGASVEGAEHAR